jgi:hypothetical protein
MIPSTDLRSPHLVRLGAALAMLTLGLPAAGLAIAQGAALLNLPESTAEDAPVLACHVVIQQDRVVVDGVQVLSLSTELGEDGESMLVVPDDEKRGMMITALYDRLREKYEHEQLGAEARETLAVLTQRRDVARQGELLLSIDKDTPFAVVREVLYTAGQAQFGTFLFVTHNPWEDAQRTIESTLPMIGPPSAMDYDERPPLNLSLLVSDRGLSVMGADAVLFPEGAADTGDDGPVLSVPCISGGACVGLDDYDWAALSEQLGKVKDEYPDDLQVIVVPESDIPYEVIVRVLDHARWAPYLPVDAEQGAWEYWKSVRRELFPFSILAGGAS